MLGAEERLIPKRLELDGISECLKPVVSYWNSLKSDDTIGPTWRDFELMELPLDLIPAAAVVDVDGDTRGLTYRYFGTLFAETFGKDSTGKSIDELPAFFSKASHQTYGWVIDDKVPVLLTLEYLRKRAATKTMEIIRLPLSDNGSDVTNVVSVGLFPQMREAV